MTAAVAVEASARRMELLARSSRRSFTPKDRTSWTKVAQSAWGIDEINKLWDYAALTEDNIGTCFGRFDGETLMGGSMGLIKISPADRKPYLFLHQLAVDEKYQNQGVGQRLLEDNYELIRNNLSPVVDTLRLTSDPFVSRNVWLYLHKGRMHSNRYLMEFFEGMEEEGGKDHHDMPSDRFYYEAKPNSAWVNGGIFPESAEYRRYMEAHPETLFTFNPEEVKNNTCLAQMDPTSKLAFVETTTNPSEAKAQWGNDASLWTEQHRRVFTELFEKQGHTAVDYVAVPDARGTMRHFIVTVKDFNENDVNCLKQAL